MKQMARETIERKEKELAKKMPNLYHFTDKKIQVGYILT